jgi:hypothetical protein
VTAPIPIPFSAWEPDKAAFQSGVLTDALNVSPVAGGYAPINGFQMGAISLTTPILGMAVFADTNLNSYIYAGSGNSIYVSDGAASFTSVYTNSTALTPAYRWQYARFVGYAVATRLDVTPVVGNLGPNPMTALTGGAPNAMVVGVVNNFLVFGNLIDGVDGARPNRVRWSGFRNPNAWGTNVGTQADFNDMPDEGGAVQAIIGREFGTVFQRYAISRMNYVGPDTVFTFDTVEKRRGAISPGAVIDAGLIAAYIADDGFFLWDGTSSTPIGSSRVNEYFRSRLTTGAEDRIVGAFDPLSQTVFWAYPTDSTLVLNERLIYSLAQDSWSRSDLQGASFASGFDVGFTLDQMAVFGPIDNITFSFDDPRFLGGRARAVGFDQSGTYSALTGQTLQAQIVTGDWQSAPGSVSYVNAIRPQVDAQDAACAAGVRPQTLADPVAYTDDSAKVLDGRCPMRVSGRFMRFRMTVPANQAWSRTTGLEVYVAGAGKR